MIPAPGQSSSTWKGSPIRRSSRRFPPSNACSGWRETCAATNRNPTSSLRRTTTPSASPRKPASCSTPGSESRAGQRHDSPGSGACYRTLPIGYGYQPWRALAWLSLLLAAGTTAFSIAPLPALQPANAPHFNAFIYTLDRLLPVVNLGQKYAFNPSRRRTVAFLLPDRSWMGARHDTGCRRRPCPAPRVNPDNLPYRALW